jgi:hypothetical protein
LFSLYTPSPTGWCSQKPNCPVVKVNLQARDRTTPTATDAEPGIGLLSVIGDPHPHDLDHLAAGAYPLGRCRREPSAHKPGQDVNREAVCHPL